MVSGSRAYELTDAGGLPVLRWPALDACGVDAVVTTRRGGVSAGAYESLNLGLHVGDRHEHVVENRSRAAGAVGLGLDDLVFADQVHGCGVSRVGRSERGRGSRAPDDALAGTDALLTTDPEVGLVIMVADCVPIVAVDPVARVLAAVHAGWRGTTGGVVEAAVERMVDLGARPERLVVGVGPAIAAERYQVGDEVAAAVRARFGRESEAARLVAADGHGRWCVDLWTANVVALRRAGVPAADIHVADVGTGGDFFSHRGANPCGRFAAIARLRP